MSTTATLEAPTIIGAYNVKGTVGHVGMPGAPIMHFNLVVVPSAHKVSGVAEITQAIQGPSGHIVVHVDGRIGKALEGQVTQLVELRGTYVQTVPPPAIGAYLADFVSVLAVNGDWKGMGWFSYATNFVDNAPVAKT